MISRSLRRTRLRCTAFPTFRLVMMPDRHSPPSGSCSTLTITYFPARVTPCSRTRENSEAARRRCAADCRMATGRRSIRRVIALCPGALRRVLPGVALELDLDTLWHQALAACFPPTAEDRAPIFRLHASAKPKLLFAGALGGLISAFGHGSEG